MGNGQFSGPGGIAVDSAGNVYVVDGNNNRIQKFTNNGTYITKWGTTGTANGQLSSPCGIPVNPKTQYVYVADRENNRIQIFSPSSYVSVIANNSSQ
jgi:DNA-binding beta-propeller fold protein YncE